MEGVLTDGMFVGVLVGGMVCLKQLVLQSGLGWRGLTRTGPLGFGGHVLVMFLVCRVFWENIVFEGFGS